MQPLVGTSLELLAWLSLMSHMSQSKVTVILLYSTLMFVVLELQFAAVMLLLKKKKKLPQLCQIMSTKRRSLLKIISCFLP